MLNNLKLISAGAGSGKTYRLTQEMADLLTSGAIRPSGIIATTFTKRAAAELKERVRVKLLREGMTREANELTNALIGTVHGLGVKLLRRFAYEAGVSPKVDIIADGDDQRLFNLSMAAVISLEQIRHIELLCDKLSLSRNGEKYNWRKDVLGLVEIIRGNNFSPEDIERSKRNSWEKLAEFLPDRHPTLTLAQYNTRIQRVLKETYEAIFANEADGTKKSESAAVSLRTALQTLKHRDYLPWLDYAKMGRYEREVGAKSRSLVAELVEIGAQHAALGAFQDDLKDYQDLLFDCARASIEEYDRYKKNRGRIDYTDMEVLVLQLLDHPSVRAALSRELDLLMVDEFQDTSPIQLAIFLRLSQLAKRSIWVGDPKQSIYGFRGAEPRLMAAVMNANGPIDPANIQTQSWRSREDIVYSCNSLFVNAFPEFKPEEVALEPVRKREGSKFAPPESCGLRGRAGLVHWHFEVEGKGRHSIAFMQATLAKAIRELLANPPLILPKGSAEERPLRAGDIAILCRSNYGCVAVAEALSGQGIPAAIARTGLLETAEATLLLACLKYMLNGGDSLSVAEIMLFGCRHSLTDIIDHRLAHLESEQHESTWGSELELLERLEDLRAITAEYSTSEILNIVLERIDLRRIAVAWGDGEQRLSNIDELRRLAVAYEDNCHRQHRAASLGGYLLYLNQLLREREDKQGAGERPEAVNVMTYHRSKGLEWPAVICFNLDQSLRAGVWGRAVIPDDPQAAVDLSNPLADRWLRYWVNPYDRLSGGIPWVDALDESEYKDQAVTEALAEEARLLYVGFTRARDYLILPTGKPGAPWVDRVYGRGGKTTTVLEPATTETPFSWAGHDVDKTNRHYTEPTSQPRSPMVHSPIPFLVGERPGRRTYTSQLVDEEFLVMRYGSSTAGETYAYFHPAEPDPATDLRLYARCISSFIAGDPGPRSGDAVREELAYGLLANFRPGGEVAPDQLIAAANSFQQFTDGNWPDANIVRNWPLRGELGGRRYRGTIDFLGEMPGGACVLIQDVCLGPKQYQAQMGARMAELRLQSELIERIHGGKVAAAFLHLPATGCLNEVVL
ncbi:ATP-dependent exoDNAse (exonuclease V) beta subunit [Lewinella aquimaris]|uniref:DNA 3'-5' helicase n=1 Tax=Neolewinella aquimaris TaxID=1835722 RepID=A0A840E257_9BACT|nr:UvrD-helicase domain-containing protein [Neolewinella aquimaris]MBB4077832.1 ATP-dependent exoDNAse (exonuclease V) beta subunit [Neolewinella aquimaris]